MEQNTSLFSRFTSPLFKYIRINKKINVLLFKKPVTITKTLWQCILLLILSSCSDTLGPQFLESFHIQSTHWWSINTINLSNYFIRKICWVDWTVNMFTPFEKDHIIYILRCKSMQYLLHINNKIFTKNHLKG